MAFVRSLIWPAAAILLASCQPREPEPAPPAPPETAAPEPLPPPPAPLLVRADLLAAVSAAADAYARGAAYPPAATAMNDRRFSLRLPFGCFGPQDEGALRYAYDSDKETLKVTAQSQSWTDQPLVRDLLGAPDAEAIEGFWIERPWMTTPDCPVTPNPGEAEPSPQSVALARVFEEGASRVLQRGRRPYEVSRRVPAPPPGGLRLVLEGRVVADPEGRAILCRSGSPDQRPVCFVRVEFDRVAFDTATGENLAEWRS